MKKEGHILIIEENSFSKVCMAMLEREGYKVILPLSFKEARDWILSGNISLIILNYPYADAILKSKVIGNIPVLMLVEQLGEEVMEVLIRLKKGICMLKPIDFEKFKLIIKKILDGKLRMYGTNIIA